tara:strand:+ start:1418 stop:2290 length:873 start_codon:yes stop_codon:yes gene_type:complete
MNNIFAMVTMKSSSLYTDLAIKSFFKFTEINDSDEFLLIDNDGNNFNNLSTYKKIKIIKNKSPLSFAENVNKVIKISKANNKNLIFLNNDIIFTKGWFDPLKNNSNCISIPASNQIFQYSSDCKNLILKITMNLKDFNENYQLLNEIVEKHKKKYEPGQKLQTPLMPFFCFKLPKEIINKIGLFDETFGKGGGEDVDYRIRCAAEGYEVNFLIDSYLLHFHGKSTWDGNETLHETEKRNKKYTEIFLKKWGQELTQIFIIRKDILEILEKKGITEHFKNGKFGDLIRKIL